MSDEFMTVEERLYRLEERVEKLESERSFKNADIDQLAERFKAWIAGNPIFAAAVIALVSAVIVLILK